MVSRGFHGMVDSRQLDCPKVSTMSPHTCQLCPRSKHKATKKRSKENAFRTRAHKLTQCAVSEFLAPQKHGARQSHGCVNPSFSEHGYPHASPPVTEPAQGAPRAIREKPTFTFVRMPNYVGNPPRNEVAKMCEAVPDKITLKPI